MSDNFIYKYVIKAANIYEKIIAEAQFKEGDKVVDVGCGSGSLLLKINEEHGSKVECLGIEPDERMRIKAEKMCNGCGVRFKRALSDRLPSIPGYYTHIICMASFHHFQKENWETTLQEFGRVLAPQGKLVIVDFAKPKGIRGWFLWLINPCKGLAKDLYGFLMTRSQEYGFRLVNEDKQFGYITHLVFTK